MRPELPYFDILLEGRRGGDPAALLFERFVHWGYWEDPSAAAADGSDLPAAMVRLNDLIVAAAAPRDGETIVDAGCGFGGTLERLGRLLPRARRVGLNIDRRQLEQARARLGPAQPDFIEADACRLPLRDGSVDRLLAVECIFHFPSRLAFLKEAARVLRPGSRLALSDFVPARPRGGGLIARWIGRVLEKGYGPSSDWPDGGYAEMARAAGLRLLEDRDITRQTLPTYPALRREIARSRLAGPLARPTALIEWLSRLDLVRYRVLAFEK